jgi:hypothetical protein
LLLLCTAGPAPAGDEIKVNALFYNKVVLTVDDERLVLSAGEQRKGIKLINANGERAIVEINGQRRRLNMDSLVARQHTTPEEFKRHSKAKSHVIEARLVDQTRDSASFEVDYYCSERLEQPARLRAKTLFRYEDTDSWTHTVTPVKPGRHTATITVGMAEDATDGYLSDAMQFSLIARQDGKTRETGALVFRFIKEWKR